MAPDSSVGRLIDAAIDEDLATIGDITAALLPDPDRHVSAKLILRKPGVFCGREVAAAVCAAFSRRLAQRLEFHAGSAVGTAELENTWRAAGDVVAGVAGPQAAVLTAERTLLNFVSRMSGVATLTRRFVDAAAAANPQVRIYDTRKTIPGWRSLDKYAVRCGGGHNHRAGLFDAVLFKDNHIVGIPPAQLAARLTNMLARLRATTLQPAFVEVEVDSLAQLDAVLRVGGVDVVLLDNFALDDMCEAVQRRDARGGSPRVELEASGGVTFESVTQIAATGVDRIAVGALTHSAAALDIGLDF